MQKLVVFLDSTLGKYMLAVGLILLIYFLVFSRTTDVNRPKVVGVALPKSEVCIDQRSTFHDERPWSVGIGAIAGRYGDRDWYGAGVFAKYSF